MHRFITRVELHAATDKDYERLRKGMEARSFRRYITDDNGLRYFLPTATFFCSGDFTVMHIRDLARSAAEDTGCRFWIFTCAYVRAAWHLYQG